MKKILLCILGVVYLIITVFMTAFLLARNEYNVTEIKGKTYYLIDQKSEKYNKGDLVIISHKDYNKLKEDDYVFYYNTYAPKMQVNVARIVENEVISDTETTYLLDNDAYISSEYVIGSFEHTTTIPLIGFPIMLLQSTWGYLLFIVLPLFIMSIFEVYNIVKETRKK